MRTLKKREKRFLIYFGLIIVFLFCDFLYRRKTVTIIKETEHYIIYSSATAEQTDEIAAVAEITYQGYLKFAEQMQKEIQPHPKLKMKLYKDRDEFRRCNRIKNWYEAYYRYPYCYQYYSSDEVNPYHWAMHEATHQLNHEVAHLPLPQWLDEGIACYISTSSIIDESLHLGQIDVNTYPIWWFETMATSGSLDSDKENLSIIPLKSIISGHGGPDMNKYFNLYYLHWWSLTHFLMHYEGGIYRSGLSQLVSYGGDLSFYEKNIGKIEDIETQWYEYIIRLKRKY